MMGLFIHISSKPFWYRIWKFAEFCRKSADDLGKKFMRLCVGDQDCFGTVRGYENLLALLPSDSSMSTLLTVLPKLMSQKPSAI